MADPKRPGRTTQPGYKKETVEEDASPTELSLPRVHPPPEPAAARHRPSTAPRRSPEQLKVQASGIEVVVVQEDWSQSQRKTAFRAVEIWTHNRVYALDSSMRCIEVINQATGETQPDHSFIGARLSGGQQRHGNVLMVSHPFPFLGSEAIFKSTSKKNGPFGQTSKVVRVVLRVRVVSVPLLQSEPIWEEITTHFHSHSEMPPAAPPAPGGAQGGGAFPRR